MTPTAPSSSVGLPGHSPQGGIQRLSLTGAEPPSAPKPDLGRAAVTQAQATAKAAMGAPGHAKRPMPEIPPDPPPVKGLGIPALNTAMVGDGDEVETPPPPQKSSTEEYVAALQPPAPNGVDRRI